MGDWFNSNMGVKTMKKEYYENGKLGSIGSYKDGKREGEWKFYKENGKLEKIVHYKNGLRNHENPTQDYYSIK